MSNSSRFTPVLLRTRSFVFFAVHETRRIFLSPFISKASRSVSSFFLSVQLSEPYLQATLAISLVVALLKSVCCDFFTFFCSDAPNTPITCPLFTWYGIPLYIHHLSNQGPKVRERITCSSYSFSISMWHAMPSLDITLVLLTMSRLYLRLTGLGDPPGTSSCCSAS